VALTSLASIIPLVVALGARSERAFLGSIVILTGSCVLADLPLHRSGAALFAAIAGAAVLAFVEAGGAALEPKGGGTHVGHPARAHAIWVGLVAIGGAAAGWLLLSVDPELSDLGLAALVLGVLAAVCLIALAAMLAATAIAGRKRL
jgi:small-conductance mechanosensitive channel